MKKQGSLDMYHNCSINHSSPLSFSYSRFTTILVNKVYVFVNKYCYHLFIPGYITHAAVLCSSHLVFFQTRTVYRGKTWHSIKKIKSKKAEGFNKIPSEIWKTRKFDNMFLWLCSAVYKQNTIEKWTSSLSLKRVILESQKITAIVVKVYNALVLTHIQPGIEKILWKNQNSWKTIP